MARLGGGKGFGQRPRARLWPRPSPVVWDGQCSPLGGRLDQNRASPMARLGGGKGFGQRPRARLRPRPRPVVWTGQSHPWVGGWVRTGQAQWQGWVGAKASASVLGQGFGRVLPRSMGRPMLTPGWAAGSEPGKPNGKAGWGQRLWPASSGKASAASCPVVWDGQCSPLGGRLDQKRASPMARLGGWVGAKASASVLGQGFGRVLAP
jgi:hypothetical protein